LGGRGAPRANRGAQYARASRGIYRRSVLLEPTYDIQINYAAMREMDELVIEGEIKSKDCLLRFRRWARPRCRLNLPRRREPSGRADHGAACRGLEGVVALLNEELTKWTAAMSGICVRGTDCRRGRFAALLFIEGNAPSWDETRIAGEASMGGSLRYLGDHRPHARRPDNRLAPWCEPFRQSRSL